MADLHHLDCGFDSRNYLLIGRVMPCWSSVLSVDFSDLAGYFFICQAAVKGLAPQVAEVSDNFFLSIDNEYLEMSLHSSKQRLVSTLTSSGNCQLLATQVSIISFVEC